MDLISECVQVLVTASSAALHTLSVVLNVFDKVHCSAGCVLFLFRMTEKFMKASNVLEFPLNTLYIQS